MRFAAACWPMPVEAGRALDIAESYAAEEREHCERATRTLCLVGIPLVVGFGLFDWARHPQIFTVSLWLRLGSALVFAVSLLALRTERGRRWARVLALLCVSVAAALILALQILSRADVNQYSSGLSMVPLAAALIVPW